MTRPKPKHATPRKPPEEPPAKTFRFEISKRRTDSKSVTYQITRNALPYMLIALLGEDDELIEEILRLRNGHKPMYLNWHGKYSNNSRRIKTHDDLPRGSTHLGSLR